MVTMMRAGEAHAENWSGFENAGSAQPLAAWNETTADFPQVCAHELFEQQVVRDPSAIAIIFGERQMTYRELNERANKLARHLRARGVGPDVLVGVCLERSPDLVVALLAVWKAGGAYVPLDPAYPPERLSFMVEDAQTRVLVTEEKCRALFASIDAIYVDTDWPRLSQEDSDNLAPNNKPSNLAYVIYTSGSTGKPKGAMIIQSGLVNYLCWAIRTYAVEPGRSVPVHSSVSFDLTVTSLYTPLLSGGKVELLPEDIGAQSLLAALLRTGDRSLVKITPAHLELLSQQISPQEAKGMTRAFVIGGENLLAEKLELWRGSASATRLINEYGPTETVVGCCIYEVQPGDPESGPVPIGRPIANTQLYILDPHMQPVPVGSMGELYIGGAGVGRGYLNRPELTAERFLADPFSQVPDARLYKSGDLARYRHDGIIEYLGRADDQVKVRGYRIELGEIEAALLAQPNVQACAVLAREDEPGDRRLVGYLVPRNGNAPNADDLRLALKETLPEYMVPSQFVVMDALPLTPNGKIDRKNLPAPARDTSGAGKGGAPKTETQKMVAAIWSEVLRVDGIGIDDDFFDLGGHSMTATALVQRLRAAFGVDLGLASLFERPTIAGLSEVVDMLVLTNRGSGSGSGSAPREEFNL
jgi:amino acid adenylation domain-containing protein